MEQVGDNAADLYFRGTGFEYLVCLTFLLFFSISSDESHINNLKKAKNDCFLIVSTLIIVNNFTVSLGVNLCS
jgi:hypothetical protein